MWLAIAVTSYFVNAAVYVADKFILSKKIHSSIVYAFYVGIWSIGNAFLLIFSPWVPTWPELFIDLSAGLIFMATLVFWYKALHQSEATRVVPIVGALIPIFSFLLSAIFLGESLSERQLLAFIILIIGGILISIKNTRFYEVKAVVDRMKNIYGHTFGGVHAELQSTRRLFINSIISAFFFAAYYVLIKYIYTTQPFIGSFVWSRFGSFIGAMLILTVPAWRRLISGSKKQTAKTNNVIFFLFVRALAAGAFILLNYAISLGNVALINSLQGVQYIFLIVIVLFLSSKFPKILKEELGGGVLMQKIIGAFLISLGLYMLIVVI